MPPDVGVPGGAKAEHGGRDQADQAETDRGEKGLGQKVTLADPPSPFVVEWVTALAPVLAAPKRALDVAMGRGRNALVLARAGFRTFGVDLNADAVREAVARAGNEGLTLRAWCADLTRSALPRGRFELVLVSRYLQRDLVGALGDALAPGGVVIYETFTVRQRELGTGPRSPDHLLAAGELGRMFGRFEQLFYEEVSSPEAVARLVARKPDGTT